MDDKMPLISDGIKNKNKSTFFKKATYRPWDNSETDASEKKLSLVDKKKTYKKDIAVEKLCRHLFGAKKVLLVYMLENIEETNNGMVITNNIVTSDIIKSSNLPTNTIKKSIQQLKEMSIISTYDQKPGRGGFARYFLSKEVYEEIKRILL